MLSSSSDTVQNSSYSQHAPVTLSEEFALPYTTAGPETVSDRSPNLLKLPVVSATGLATVERKELIQTDIQADVSARKGKTEGPGPP